MITIDRLKYFVELAKTEHVGKAAKITHVSPSVISTAISTLEEELGCKLFDRGKKRLKLNTNGHFLLEKAKGILADVEGIYSEISDVDLDLKGHFKLGGSPILVRDLLIRSFLNIKEANPNLTAEFHSNDTPATVASIHSGALDLALVFKSFQYHDIEEYHDTEE